MEEESVSLHKMLKSAKKYFSNLCQCMSLKDGVIYGKNHISEYSHILTLIPRDICNYFHLKAFGTASPDDNATSKLGISSSLIFYKKPISYYMTNKLMGWNVETKHGNPTKSIKVNQLIQKVQRMETRKQGKRSQAKMPFTVHIIKTQAK